MDKIEKAKELLEALNVSVYSLPDYLFHLEKFDPESPTAELITDETRELKWKEHVILASEVCQLVGKLLDEMDDKPEGNEPKDRTYQPPRPWGQPKPNIRALPQELKDRIKAEAIDPETDALTEPQKALSGRFQDSGWKVKRVPTDLTNGEENRFAVLEDGELVDIITIHRSEKELKEAKAQAVNRKAL